MESREPANPRGNAAAASAEAPDRAGIGLSREIFHLLTHAVTAMKLYPSHHATVLGFFDDLHLKLGAYFESRSELEVTVQEYAFLVGGEAVYEEKHLAKSLPYLFHKDGMRKFTILKEIDKTELREFLEVIRKTSLLPLDESDVVVALWERDLPDIRIFAPDDYLLAKIDIFTRQPFELFIDRRQLYGGQIALSSDDLKEIESESLSLGLMEQEEKLNYAEMVITTEEEDQAQIEWLLSDARKVPAEKEFHDMLFELLHLEARTEEIASLVGFLQRHHHELVREDKFSHAAQFFRQIEELKNIFAERQPEKAALLEKFLGAIPDGRSAEVVQEAIERKSFDSIPSFFDYLKFLGALSIPLAARLLDEGQEPEVRRRAFAYLEAAGKKDIKVLAAQLQDGKPAISKEIIVLIGSRRDEKGLIYLAPVSTYQNKEIKLAAVEVLASFQEPVAQKILFAFLQDEDEEIVAAAADALQWPGSKTVLGRIIRMISARSFQDREIKAKIAIMSFLARSGVPEAMKALHKAMEKSGLFARAKRQHTRMCCVAALAAAGTPEARELLEQGLKSSKKDVSEGCRRALERWPKKVNR